MAVSYSSIRLCRKMRTLMADYATCFAGVEGSELVDLVGVLRGFRSVLDECVGNPSVFRTVNESVVWTSWWGTREVHSCLRGVAFSLTNDVVPLCCSALEALGELGLEHGAPAWTQTYATLEACVAMLRNQLESSIAVKGWKLNVAGLSSLNTISLTNGGGSEEAGRLLRAVDSACEAHLNHYWEELMEFLVLPEYLAAKWTATSKFMAGRVPHHGILYTWATLLKQLKVLFEFNLEQHIGACISALVACWVRTWVRIRASSVRTAQLKTDVLYFCVLIRSLRHHYDSSVDRLLMKAVVTVSCRTMPIDDLVPVVEAACAPDPSAWAKYVDELPNPSLQFADFIERVWNSTPLSRSDLMQQKLGQLYHPTGFLPSATTANTRICPLTHEELSAIAVPTPNMNLASICEAPDAATASFVVAAVRLRWEFYDSYPKLSEDEEPTRDRLQAVLKEVSQ